MEDYREKYEKALLTMRQKVETGVVDKCHAESVFPELCDSEDERIRKILINETKDSGIILFDAITNEQFIAWLERQCNQKPSTIKFDEESPQTLDEISKNGYVDMNRPIELTIQDEPDFERMVEEYKKGLRREVLGVPCNSLYFDASGQIYRQGLEDMYKRLKG